MNPQIFLSSYFLSMRNLLRKEDGQLYCALCILNSLSQELDTYYPKLLFAGETKEVTKEYWIEKTETYLRDVCDVEKQVAKILKCHGNKWDGNFQSIGTQWHNEGLNQSEDSEWRNSIWYLLNISTRDEDKMIKQYEEKINQWRRDKAVLLDYYYRQLLSSLRERLIKESIHQDHETKPVSIDQYKVAFLLYTKFRSFAWSHDDIKVEFPELAIRLIHDLQSIEQANIPCHWDEWLDCPLRLFPNLLDDSMELKSGIEKSESYFNSLIEYIQNKDIELKRPVTKTSLLANLAQTPSKTSSFFNCNDPFYDIDATKLNSLINEVRTLFYDVIDSSHDKEFELFLSKRKSYFLKA